MKKLLCPKCLQIRQRSRHHIFPVRHFGRKNNNTILYLCQECHQHLETFIPPQRKSRLFYIEVVQQFLGHP
jgi:hypothetical protein